MLNEKKDNKAIYTSSTESLYESDFKDDLYVDDFKDNKNIKL